jgi:hypothetical protein
MKPARYFYEFRDGIHGIYDARRNQWKDTFFSTARRARLWIASKNKAEGRVSIS